MKKLFLLFVACTLSLAATAQTMNIHLKDGSTVHYTSDAVSYVDFTAGAVETPAVGDSLWSVWGTYSCADLDKSWSAKLIAYPNDAYVIESWMGVEGYDLAFTVTSSGELSCDYTVDAYQYYQVPTGLMDYPTAYLYTAWGCSSFTGDSKSGSLRIYNYINSGGYDSFSWGDPTDDNTTDNNTGDTTGGIETPDEEVWSLVSDSVSFVEYYGNVPSFTCSLYKNADGTKYYFKDFAEGYDLHFTADTAVSGWGYYIVPTGGSKYNDSYWYFGDDYWNNSFPLQLKNSEYYADYGYIYTHSSYSTINPSTRSGWLCCYYNLYDAEGNYVSNTWVYYTFSWPSASAAN